MTLIYVDLLHTPPLSERAFDEIHARALMAAELDDNYQRYLATYQPWRLLVISGDNQKPLFRSTERYFNRADAINAADKAFGRGSNVYLREAEHGNVLLRLASDYTNRGGTT